jgi:hypothetical protein
VSRAYVVATLHHTYEVTVAMFADGRMIPFPEESARGTEAPTPDEMRRWAAPRIDVWAAELGIVGTAVCGDQGRPILSSQDLCHCVQETFVLHGTAGNGWLLGASRGFPD